MLFMGKSFGLVSETEGFLVNPGPEPSEPAVVETSERRRVILTRKSNCLVNKTESFLVNPVPEASEHTARVARCPFCRQPARLARPNAPFPR